MTIAWGLRLVFGFLLGVLLSYYGTPIMRRAAISINLVDKPDGRLKHQREPVPYLGGLAVYLAFLLSISLAYEFDPQILALLLAGTIVLLLGLIDDFGVLSPGSKFIGQCIAVYVLMRAGIRIQLVFVPDWIELPLSFFWLLGVCNAFNLIDIMDGLAGGVACLSCLAFTIVNLLAGDYLMAFLALTLGGSILGFLRFNFDPARIYLGDAGSLFIGLMMGALAMIGKYTAVSVAGALAPILVLGVPLFDTLFVMYVRRRRGVSVFLGSPDHFPLRLRKWRLDKRQTVLTSWSAAFLLGLAGIAMTLAPLVVALAVFGSVFVVLLAAAAWLRRINMTM